MHRGEDAKRQSLLRFELLKKIDKFLSLNFLNILISPLEGEKKFLSELCELSNKGRLGILAQREACKISCNKLFQHKTELKRIEPLSRISNAHYHSQRTAPSPRWGEGIDFVIINNFSETVFSRFTSHFSHKRTAFTLAEVLITLGIIGIVAALTLPNIINNYKRKQLEVAFKRSSALIQSALNETANDFGFDSFKDINSTCVDQNELNSCKSNNQEFFNSVSSTFISKFKVIKQAKNIDAAKFEGKVIPVYNFSGKQTLYYSQFYGIQRGGYFLSDGTYITGLLFYYHGAGDCVTLTFDTNGPYKGPNRYGYDIFIYTTGHWGLLCSKNTSQPGGFGVDTNFNGRGCYTYALKDVNPDDSSKGYWKSLK